MEIDLTTEYLGLKLRNPLIVSASPLTGLITTLEQLEVEGAAAVVLPSLFEEQLLSEGVANPATPTFSSPVRSSGIGGSSLTDYNTGPDGYMKRLEIAKRSLSIPVIGSLNASSRGAWLNYATLMEQAGADAIELNIYFVPSDIEITSAEVEDRYLEIVNAVRAAVSIPIAVKIGPYFASLPNVAQRLSRAGASGIVLFNRFLEPELDIDNFAILPHLDLSTPRELRLSLRWIGILYDQLPLSLAATSGIHESRDLIKALLAGADVTMVASTLLRHGPHRVSELLAGLKQWLETKKFSSVKDMRGLLSRQAIGSPAQFERANYLEAIASYSKKFE